MGQIEKIQGILNERGLDGWELVQVAFGKDGIMMFWKRRLPPEDAIEGEGDSAKSTENA